MADEPTSDEPTSDEPTSDEPTSEEPTSEAVAPPAPPTTAPPTTAPTPTAPTPTAATSRAPREPLTWSTGRVIAIVAIVLLLGGGVGVLIGRSTADTGPATLADAVHDTANGDLPRGDLSVGDALGALGANGKSSGADLGDVLGNLFGKDGSSKDLRGLLGDLFDQLKGDTSGGSAATSGHPYLGVATQDAPSGQSGARVVGVTAGSPAADAGLRVDDVVTALDGTTVGGPADLLRVVQSHDPGDSVAVTYTRDGQSSTIQVRLGNLDTATSPSGSSSTPASPAPSTTLGA
jgi:membrane-associated protease RseP (regulator of RpoE activity)